MAQSARTNVVPFDKPSASVVCITPEIAERWLGRNGANRNIRPKKVEQYARDMESGQWKLTGEAIKFDHSGNLIDGQHRLEAIRRSGQTIQMFVVRGLDNEAQRVMDSGASRSCADDLHMAGKENSVLLASCARLILRYHNGGDSWSYQPTRSEVYAVVEQDYPDVALAAGIASRVAKWLDINPSVIAFCAWMIGNTAGYEAAEEFFGNAASMVGLQQADPIIAMVKAFSEVRRQRKSYDVRTQVSAIIRSFNAWSSGKQIKQLKFISPNGIPVGIPPVTAIKRNLR